MLFTYLRIFVHILCIFVHISGHFRGKDDDQIGHLRSEDDGHFGKQSGEWYFGILLHMLIVIA